MHKPKQKRKSLGEQMAKRMANPVAVAGYKAIYEDLLAAPETEGEYLLRRLNMLLNGPHPGPADYVKVREDRRKWEAKK